MSTGLECTLVEDRPGEWFYVLQNPNCPRNCWDWREEGPFVDGPFSSLEAACKAAERRHGNPGGWWEVPLAPGRDHAPHDAVMAELIAQARRQPGPYQRWLQPAMPGTAPRNDARMSERVRG